MITVRKFKSGDEDGAWDVFYSSIHQVCSKDYSEEQIHAWAPADLDPSIWISKIQSIKPFVAVTGEKIIGYADLQKDGKIDHFFVHGDHQAEGVGGSLMKKIIEKGVNNKRLYSEVSHTAKPFYEKYGFNVTKVQLVKMHGVTLENNIMERCN
jgi:putative acetyltransferase